MLQNNGSDLLADGNNGVQGGHGVLENSGDLAAADLGPVLVELHLRQIEHAGTVKLILGLVQVLNAEHNSIKDLVALLLIR